MLKNNNSNNDDRLCTHVHMVLVLGLHINVGTYFIVL
jgi:hypothetical protein